MAYNKVVISGINTSELTVLKEEEKIVMDSALQRLGYRSAAEWFREQYRYLLRQYQTALTFDKG